MPYMKKIEKNELIAKIEKILSNFNIPHYYKIPKEDDTVQLAKEILAFLKNKV